MVKPGEIAPDFKLPTESGELVTLSSFRGVKNVVLFFYPADDTPGCTREACAFRDEYSVFEELGAEVFGISSNDVESHASFASKYHLPFRLLVDTGGKIRQQFGVSRTLGLMPGRVTFIIDQQGRVQHVFSSQFHPTRHVEEALNVLRRLAK